MIRRWGIYLAVLAGSMGLYGAFPGWITWIAVLTVAGSPLSSVAVSAIRKETDALGLFRLPDKRRPEEYIRELRPYRPGDSLSRVRWKLAAKTGALTVWEERVMERRVPQSRRRMVAPIALCFAVLFCIFPPGEYERQMRDFRGLFVRQPEVRLELASAGPRSTSKQAVLDVVASQPQLLYLRGQAYDVYDGQSWQAFAMEEWSVWEPKGKVIVAARAHQDMTVAPYDGVEEKPSKRCLQLPRETKAWAEGILDTLPDGARVEQIQVFVRSCAKYDENTPAMPENGDFVRWFAENSGRGYCVHFATAAAVLLRAAGIPARIVTGFVVDVQAGLRKTVAQGDAHAWVEYWDGGAWRILEATPTVEAATLPEMQKKTESNAPNAIFWALPCLVIFGFLLLFRRRREDPRQRRLKELKQKAAFSRDGLTEEEKREMEASISCLPLWGRCPLSQKSKIFASSPKGRAKGRILFPFLRNTREEREGKAMKQEEKKPIPWEVADPKPPVIQSGKMENRKQN